MAFRQLRFDPKGNSSTFQRRMKACGLRFRLLQVGILEVSNHNTLSISQRLSPRPILICFLTFAFNLVLIQVEILPLYENFYYVNFDTALISSMFTSFLSIGSALHVFFAVEQAILTNG